MANKIAFTKDGAVKMIDPDDKNQVAVIEAAGWASDAPKRGRPAKVEAD